MGILENLALVVLFLVMVGVIIYGSKITVERIRGKDKDEITYHPPSEIDRINNNLNKITATLDDMQKKQKQNELEDSIEEGYRVKLRVADGHTAFSGTRYTITEHLIEADNFVNDGDWITLYKKDKKVATHPTEQVEFITKL